MFEVAFSGLYSRRGALDRVLFIVVGGGVYEEETDPLRRLRLGGRALDLPGTSLPVPCGITFTAQHVVRVNVEEDGEENGCACPSQIVYS